MTDVMNMLNDLAKNLTAEELRTATRDWMTWHCDGIPPVVGPLAQLASAVKDESIGTRKRLHLAGAAVLQQFPEESPASVLAGVVDAFGKSSAISVRGVVVRLYDESGDIAEHANGFDAEVTFDHLTKRARAVDAAGNVLGELVDPYLERISADGIVLVGLESMKPLGGLRRQSWTYVPRVPATVPAEYIG